MVLRIAIGVIALVLTACNKPEETYEIYAVDEMAQQIGDAMVSIDESGGSSSGSITKINTTGDERVFARLSQEPGWVSRIAHQDISNLFISKSYAADCSSVAYGSCTGAVLTRDFSAGCTVAGAGVLTGNVRLTFTGTGAGTCTIPANADYVSRVPNYTITGLRGAKFQVTATSTGQRITRIGPASFSFTNAGINRKFTNASDKVVLDVTTSTSGAIGVTGTARHNRSATGGGILIVDNLTGLSCTLSPNSVVWDTACNCPVSGSWAGTCSDSETLTVAFSGLCGETTLTKGSTIKSVKMDRCQP